jgi:hypothetical protein
VIPRVHEPDDDILWPIDGASLMAGVSNGAVVSFIPSTPRSAPSV